MITRNKAEEILDALIKDSIKRIKNTLANRTPYWENFNLWRQTSLDCLEQIYGPNHRNVIEFSQIRFANPSGDTNSQNVTFIVGIISAKERLLASMISVKSYWLENVKTNTYPIIFLSCSDKSEKIAGKIKTFLINLGARVVYVVDEPNLNLSIEDKVTYYMAQCDCGIAVLTGDEKLFDGKPVNKRNIDHEIGLLTKSSNINNRIIILRESNVEKATNYQEKVHISFNRATFGDDVFPSLVRELRGFGYF
ncbi:MAG: TIR domain-containing protein [Candidatus Levyibacteriota bacterium]